VRPLSGSCDSSGHDPLQTSVLSSLCTGEQSGGGAAAMMAVAPYAITETALATIWVCTCIIHEKQRDCLAYRKLIEDSFGIFSASPAAIWHSSLPTVSCLDGTYGQILLIFP
jgi:hypothetical protein